MTLAFTICSNNYLAQALTLGNSLLTHNPNYIFKIALVDRRNESVDYRRIPYEVIEVESIDIKSFNNMFMQYNITELNTAVKPFYFFYFLNNYPEIDQIIFLDPDIFVYSSFFALDQVLKNNEIVIMPHFTTPLDDDKSQTENDFLNTGIYNLGFIALKRGGNTLNMLTWWAKRLETKAYIKLEKGMFTDQIWINYVPLFFNNVCIFLHPGYNMAYWNMHERFITNIGIVNKNGISYPLVFFHFSGFNPLKPDILSKHQNRFTFENRKDVATLFEDYCEQLRINNFEEYSMYSCYFSRMKQEIEQEAYSSYKLSIPLYKRIIRGFILRFIRLFRINIEYYIR